MQGNQSEHVRPDVSACLDAIDAGRHALEALIDEIATDSFPASDAPSWGVAGARLRALLSRSGDADQVGPT
jgi:hypothetical protein